MQTAKVIPLRGEDNFAEWNHQLCLQLEFYDLTCFINSDVPCPDDPSAAHYWRRTRIAIYNLIYSSTLQVSDRIGDREDHQRTLNPFTLYQALLRIIPKLPGEALTKMVREFNTISITLFKTTQDFLNCFRSLKRQIRQNISRQDDSRDLYILLWAIKDKYPGLYQKHNAERERSLGELLDDLQVEASGEAKRWLC